VRRGLKARLGTEADDPTVTATLALFQRCYREHSFVLSKVFPGVPETLVELRARGLTLGCITNKPKAFADDLLRRAGLSAHLAFVYGADSFAARKPDPLPLLSAASDFNTSTAEAVMVGDSINDLRAADGAGFRFVFAAYGYAASDDPELAACPDAIREFSELTGLLSG